MKKEKINGHDFVFYDSIEDLPISQFHKYSKYVLVDSGIGSDIASVDAHIEKLAKLIGNDDEKAKRELLNYRRCLYMVSQEQDTRFKGYLCLVYKVDGKVWEDFTEEGVNELYLMCMGGETKRMLELFSEMKDRIDYELGQYFPNIFSDSVGKNYEILVRKRAMLQVASIVDDVDNEEEIAKLDKELMRYIKPKSFEGTSENAEIAFDKQFENMCLAMAKEFGGRIKDYTVMEFYSAYESLEKQSAELKKIRRK